jgi:outer membrane biosynthesis protein TonB
VIAASGILVVVAFVTLIVGVFRTGLGLIWTSIAASVLAAIFLALGVVQGNKRRVATAGGPPAPMPSWADQPATTAVMERERVPAQEEVEEEEPAPTLVAVPEPEPEPEPAYTQYQSPPPAAKPAPTRAARPAAAKPAAKKPAAKKAAAASSGSVVVIPDRDKFHRDSCRYAKNPAAMSMTKAAAKRQGYKPCATCKP